MLYQAERSRITVFLFEWKGMGKGKYIVFAVLYVLLPLMHMALYLKYGAGEQLTAQIYRSTNFFVPVCSIVWLLLILQEYVGNGGSELYFLYERGKWRTVIRYSLLYIAALLPNYILYISLDTLFVAELLKQIFLCLFCCSFCYFCVMLLQSSVAAAASIVAYVVYCMYFHAGGYTPMCYYYEQTCTPELLKTAYAPMLCAMLAWSALAVWINAHAVCRCYG